MERGRPPPPTPLPPLELARIVEELRGLLAEVVAVADAGHLWGLRALRTDVERALRSPFTLASAQNQVDLVETLTDAVWEASEVGFGGLGPDASRDDEAAGRRLDRVGQRLEHIADDLAQRVDDWRRRGAALGSPSEGRDPHRPEAVSHTPSQADPQAHPQ